MSVLTSIQLNLYLGHNGIKGEGAVTAEYLNDRPEKERKENKINENESSEEVAEHVRSLAYLKILNRGEKGGTGITL